jgi:hypothetical protein
MSPQGFIQYHYNIGLFYQSQDQTANTASLYPPLLQPLQRG